MRQDLDRLMQERGIAGIVVLAQDRYTPAMHYVTGQRIVHGVYFRAADGRAHLIHDPMERDQAALAGCDTSSFPQHELPRLQEEEGSPARAFGRLIGQTCAALGMAGPVGFFGEMPAGFAWQMIERAREVHPALVVDRAQPDVLTLARTTKDEAEIEAIRRSSLATAGAVGDLYAYLRGLRRHGEHFTDGAGRVTLGDLRRRIHRSFLERGVAEDGESIVAQGRDAGVPHNRGNDAEPLRAGAPVIVDLFPGEAGGGGYHSDLTRTFVMGRAPDDVRRLFQDVHDAFRAAVDGLRLGAPCRDANERVCDLFEARGHATLRSRPGTEEGYCHGLGHGVGLAVHEAPRMSGPPSNTAVLEPGMVITIEPGLYYPSRGMGARIEDLFVVRADGTFENLTPAPYDFEIEAAG
uniref:Aminopeptidase P family protein n=1 Tax=Eiseniibacteriota bacterium TaxID=2212470 RepID=A0A832MJ45_UNCEI